MEATIAHTVIPRGHQNRQIGPEIELLVTVEFDLEDEYFTVTQIEGDYDPTTHIRKQPKDPLQWSNAYEAYIWQQVEHAFDNDRDVQAAALHKMKETA